MDLLSPRKTLDFGLSFRSLLFLVAFVGFTAASAAEQPSHLGQDIANHVTLRMTVFGTGGQGDCAPSAARIFPDGTENFEFTIPSDKSLVVTDVQWIAQDNFQPEAPPLEVGRNLSLHLFLGGEFPTILFSSPLLVTGENINALAKSEHMTAGFMMSAIPCGALVQEEDLDDVHPAFGSVRLYGYLIQTVRRSPAIR